MLGNVYVRGEIAIENGIHPKEELINQAYFKSLRQLSEKLQN
jgi:hypothetical protein